MYRKRPFAFQPPRAFQLTGERSSGLPSRVVIAATTMMYALMTSKEIVGEYSSMGMPVLFSLIVYLGASFSRVRRISP